MSKERGGIVVLFFSKRETGRETGDISLCEESRAVEIVPAAQSAQFPAQVDDGACLVVVEIGVPDECLEVGSVDVDDSGEDALPLGLDGILAMLPLGTEGLDGVMAVLMLETKGCEGILAMLPLCLPAFGLRLA